MNDDTDVIRGSDQPLVVPADTVLPDAMDDADDTAEIRVEIAQTQADLSETINAIQEKLSPQTLAEQAKESVRETATGMVEQARETVRDATIGKAEQMVSSVGATARGTGSSLVETIKQNPVPTALALAGIGWLWMNRAQGTSGRDDAYRTGYAPAYQAAGSYGTPGGVYGSGGASYQTVRMSGSGGSGVQEAARQAVTQVQDTAGHLVSQAQSGMSQLAGGAQSSAGAVAMGTQQQAQRAQGQLQQMLQETPLAVGGIALALGAAVGLAIPETPQENQVLGEARDTLMQKAQETAQDTMHKAQNVAQKAGSAAVDAAKDEATQEGLR